MHEYVQQNYAASKNSSFVFYVHVLNKTVHEARTRFLAYVHAFFLYLMYMHMYAHMS